MTDRSETLKAIGLLFETIQFLQETSNTRLNGFSPKLILDLRKKLEEFHEKLGILVNRQVAEKTGDARPLIDVRRMK